MGSLTHCTSTTSQLAAVVESTGFERGMDPSRPVTHPWQTINSRVSPLLCSFLLLPVQFA